MPYIIVNVMGRASERGNGSLWIDGHPFSLIKNGQVINIGAGVHNVKYVPTLKKSEWSTTATFGANTVMIANVLDDDFAPPKFETYDVNDAKLAELKELEAKQKEESKKAESKLSIGGIVKVIVAILVIGLIASACGFI